MDYIRECYRSQWRLYRDRPDVLTWGRWYWCPEGAAAIPGQHRMRSSTHDFDPWVDDSIGEVRQARPLTLPGVPNPRYTGQGHHCGTVAHYQTGSLYAERGTPPTDVEGVPTCCDALPVADPEPILRVMLDDGSLIVEDVETIRIDSSDFLTLTQPAGDEVLIGYTAPPFEGTVTSVGLAAPAEFAVGGSPITEAGTLVLAWADTQQPNWLLPPSDGSVGPPTFRPYVTADFRVGVIPIQALQSFSGVAASVLGNDGTAAPNLTEVSSTTVGHVLQVVTAAPGVAPSWGFLTLAQISDAGTMAAEDAADFAAVSHTHTLSAITDAGSMAAEDAGDYLPAASYPGQPLGWIYTATDESTTSATPANLATDATFMINTGSTRMVEFEAFVETYNATVPAIHSLTIEVDGVDTTFSRLITAANTIHQLRARVLLSVATGDKTVRLQYGTNTGTARFLRRSLTAVALE